MLLFSVRCFCLFLQTSDLLLLGSEIFQPLCIRSGQCCLLLSFQLAVQGFLTTAHFLIKLLIANLGHDGCIASLIYREGFAAMGTFNFIHETSLLFIVCNLACPASILRTNLRKVTCKSCTFEQKPTYNTKNAGECSCVKKHPPALTQKNLIA